jgi:hypothetical protein
MTQWRCGCATYDRLILICCSTCPLQLDLPLED